MDTTGQPTDANPFRSIKFDLQSVPTEVVIQEIQSRLYLSETDFLTPKIADARRFDSCSTALEETTHLKLANVQLVTNNERHA